MKRQLQLRSLVVTSGAIFAFAFSPTSLAADPERPYQGSCSTVILPLTPPGVFPQQQHIDYECTLAHLGRTTAVATQTVTPVAPPANNVVALLVQNTTTYKAANGDQLFVSFTGTAVLNLATGEVAFIGVETFNGGTGRFAKATGSAQLEGTASTVTNRGFFTSKGRISY
jgi:predicted small integral membrane protein